MSRQQQRDTLYSLGSMGKPVWDVVDDEVLGKRGSAGSLNTKYHIEVDQPNPRPREDDRASYVNRGSDPFRDPSGDYSNTIVLDTPVADKRPYREPSSGSHHRQRSSTEKASEPSHQRTASGSSASAVRVQPSRRPLHSPIPEEPDMPVPIPRAQDNPFPGRTRPRPRSTHRMNIVSRRTSKALPPLPEGESDPPIEQTSVTSMTDDNEGSRRFFGYGVDSPQVVKVQLNKGKAKAKENDSQTGSKVGANLAPGWQVLAATGGSQGNRLLALRNALHGQSNKDTTVQWDSSAPPSEATDAKQGAPFSGRIFGIGRSKSAREPESTAKKEKAEKVDRRRSMVQSWVPTEWDSDYAPSPSSGRPGTANFKELPEQPRSRRGSRVGQARQGSEVPPASRQPSQVDEPEAAMVTPLILPQRHSSDRLPDVDELAEIPSEHESEAAGAPEKTEFQIKIDKVFEPEPDIPPPPEYTTDPASSEIPLDSAGKARSQKTKSYSTDKDIGYRDFVPELRVISPTSKDSSEPPLPSIVPRSASSQAGSAARVVPQSQAPPPRSIATTVDSGPSPSPSPAPAPAPVAHVPFSVVEPVTVGRKVSSSSRDVKKPIIRQASTSSQGPKQPPARQASTSTRDGRQALGRQVPGPSRDVKEPIGRQVSSSSKDTKEPLGRQVSTSSRDVKEPLDRQPSASTGDSRHRPNRSIGSMRIVNPDPIQEEIPPPIIVTPKPTPTPSPRVVEPEDDIEYNDAEPDVEEVEEEGPQFVELTPPSLAVMSPESWLRDLPRVKMTALPPLPQVPRLIAWRSGPIEVQAPLYGALAEEGNYWEPEERIRWFDHSVQMNAFAAFEREVRDTELEVELGKFAFMQTFDEMGGKGGIFMPAEARDINEADDGASLETFWMTFEEAKETRDHRLMELIADYDPQIEFIVFLYILHAEDPRIIAICPLLFSLDHVPHMWKKKWKAGHPASEIMLVKEDYARAIEVA